MKPVWDAWAEPQHDFGPPSVFRLFQAFTAVLTDRVNRQPTAFSAQTIRLHGLLDGLISPRGGDGSAEFPFGSEVIRGQEES